MSRGNHHVPFSESNKRGNHAYCIRRLDCSFRGVQFATSHTLFPLASDKRHNKTTLCPASKDKEEWCDERHYECGEAAEGAECYKLLITSHYVEVSDREGLERVIEYSGYVQLFLQTTFVLRNYFEVERDKEWRSVAQLKYSLTNMKRASGTVWARTVMWVVAIIRRSMCLTMKVQKRNVRIVITRNPISNWK